MVWSRLKKRRTGAVACEAGHGAGVVTTVTTSPPDRSIRWATDDSYLSDRFFSKVLPMGHVAHQPRNHRRRLPTRLVLTLSPDLVEWEAEAHPGTILAPVYWPDFRGVVIHATERWA